MSYIKKKLPCQCSVAVESNGGFLLSDRVIFCCDQYCEEHTTDEAQIREVVEFEKDMNACDNKLADIVAYLLNKNQLAIDVKKYKFN